MGDQQPVTYNISYSTHFVMTLSLNLSDSREYWYGLAHWQKSKNFTTNPVETMQILRKTRKTFVAH